jgi:hypothetical protein
VSRAAALALTLYLSLLTAYARPSHAASIEYYGAWGADGADGAPGNPGGEGAPGSPGESATAIASSADDQNWALAEGGKGGVGGDGGTGVPAGSPSGSGGAGGDGGDATALAERTSTTGAGPIDASAEAHGGAGSWGGFSPGPPVGPAPGGAGGHAQATATAESVTPGAAVYTGANAVGGAGSSWDPGLFTRVDGGAGGDATATATAESADVASATASAVGGSGGDGAGPGSVGGAGGTASVSAHAIGGQSASAQVEVHGGRGGGGVAAAAPGGDVSLVNVPIAESPGAIYLQQEAYGGDSGLGPGSRGGDARSELTATRTSGTGLGLTAIAQGGSAASPDAHGGDAIAFVQGIASGAQPVDVYATAAGGGGLGPNGYGGQARLLDALGQSDSGDVTVYGNAWGGSGDHAQSLDLVNVARGTTTGNLALGQTASGGGSTVSPGDARSILTHYGSSASLSLSAVVNGGASEGANAVTGGDAWAEVAGNNGAGLSYSNAGSYGGNVWAGVGGAAFTRTTSETSGVNHDSYSEGRAYGGSGGQVVESLDGRGGSATTFSRSYVDGAGGSSTAFAEAVGGNGVATFSTTIPIGGYGNADARAYAPVGVATPEIRAVALAAGGTGSTDPYDPYDPDSMPYGSPTLLGTGDALALAQGTAAVLHAEARTSGNRYSDAESQIATLHGELLGGSVHMSGATMSADGAYYGSLHSLAEFGANANPAESRAEFQYSDSSSALLAAPSIGVNPADWIAGNSHAEALNGTVLAKGMVTSAGYKTPDLTTEIRIDLDPGQIAASPYFALAFLDPLTRDAASFDVLHVQIAIDGVPYYSLDLGFLQALVALDDLVVPLAGVTSSVSVTYAFESTDGIGRFTSDFALIGVPEPGAVLLAALALTALAAARRIRG